MPQIQIDVLASMYRNLPKIADELEKMNKLKALELRLKIDRTVKSTSGWFVELDKIIEPRLPKSQVLDRIVSSLT